MKQNYRLTPLEALPLMGQIIPRGLWRYTLMLLTGLTQMIQMAFPILLPLVFGVLVLCSCFSSGRSGTYSADFYYEMGTGYYDHGELKRAEAMYLKAIKLKPHYTECYIQLGFIYYFFCEDALIQGKNIQELNQYYNQSYNCFQRALKYKTYARPYLGLARLYISASKLDEAIELINQAQTVESEDVLIQAECHYLRGRCYSLQEKYQEAKTELEEYLNLMPTGPETENARLAIRLIDKELNKSLAPSRE